MAITPNNEVQEIEYDLSPNNFEDEIDFEASAPIAADRGPVDYAPPESHVAPPVASVSSNVTGIGQTEDIDVDDSLFFAQIYSDYQGSVKDSLGGRFDEAKYLVNDMESGEKIDLLRTNFSDLPQTIKDGLMQGRIELTAPSLAAQKYIEEGRNEVVINEASFTPEAELSEEERAEQLKAAELAAQQNQGEKRPPGLGNTIDAMLGNLLRNLSAANAPKKERVNAFKDMLAQNDATKYKEAVKSTGDRLNRIMSPDSSMHDDITRALASGHPGELDVIAAKIKAKHYAEEDIKEMHGMKKDLSDMHSSFKKAIKSNKGLDSEEEIQNSHKSLLEMLEKSKSIFFTDAGKSIMGMITKMSAFFSRHLGLDQASNAPEAIARTGP